MERGDPIIVKWVDAVRYSGVYPISEADYGTHLVETHGAYLCTVGEGDIVLAEEVVDDTQVRGVHVIPKGMVVDVIVLARTDTEGQRNED